MGNLKWPDTDVKSHLQISYGQENFPYSGRSGKTNNASIYFLAGVGEGMEGASK